MSKTDSSVTNQIMLSS